MAETITNHTDTLTRYSVTKTICLAVCELAEGKTDGPGLRFCKEVGIENLLPNPAQPRDPIPTPEPTPEPMRDLQPITNNQLDGIPDRPAEKGAVRGSKEWWTKVAKAQSGKSS